MYSNFSVRTTVFIRLICNRQRKVLFINRQSSVLNSICNKGGYTNEIRKRTRNTSTTVYMVSFVRRKGIEWTTQPFVCVCTCVCLCVCFCGDRCVNENLKMRFSTSHSHSFSVSIRIIADVPPTYSVIETGKYYVSVGNHQYLIRCVIKVDIQSRFGKVQGIQRYPFYLRLSCTRIFAHESPFYP